MVDDDDEDGDEEGDERSQQNKYRNSSMNKLLAHLATIGNTDDKLVFVAKRLSGWCDDQTNQFENINDELDKVFNHLKVLNNDHQEETKTRTSCKDCKEELLEELRKFKEEFRVEMKADMREELRREIGEELRREMGEDLRRELREDLRRESKDEDQDDSCTKENDLLHPSISTPESSEQ